MVPSASNLFLAMWTLLAILGVAMPGWLARRLSRRATTGREIVGLVGSSLSLAPGLVMLPDALRHFRNGTSMVPGYGPVVLVAVVGFPFFVALLARALYVCVRPQRSALVWAPAIHTAFYFATFAEAFLFLAASV